MTAYFSISIRYSERLQTALHARILYRETFGPRHSISNASSALLRVRFDIINIMSGASVRICVFVFARPPARPPERKRACIAGDFPETFSGRARPTELAGQGRSKNCLRHDVYGNVVVVILCTHTCIVLRDMSGIENRWLVAQPPTLNRYTTHAKYISKTNGAKNVCETSSAAGRQITRYYNNTRGDRVHNTSYYYILCAPVGYLYTRTHNIYIYLQRLKRMRDGRR